MNLFYELAAEFKEVRHSLTATYFATSIDVEADSRYASSSRVLRSCKQAKRVDIASMKLLEDESSTYWVSETVDTEEMGEGAAGDDAAADVLLLEYSAPEFGDSIFEGKAVPSCSLLFAFRFATARVALRLSTH